MKHQLHYTRFKTETAFDYSLDQENTIETYLATPIGNGLFLGKVYDENTQKIYSREVGYLGYRELTHVATLLHKTQKVMHTHGYYAPHKTGKKVLKYADSIDFKVH